MSDQHHWLVLPGQLELRKRGTFYSLSGRFPYNRTATVRDRGRTRKERVASDGFGWQIREFERVQAELAETLQGAIDQARVEILQEQLQRRNIHVLAGHDFDKPLGSMLAGNAKFASDSEALTFDVELPDVAQRPSWMRDAVQAVEAGLVGGDLGDDQRHAGRLHGVGDDVGDTHDVRLPPTPVKHASACRERTRHGANEPQPVGTA